MTVAALSSGTNDQPWCRVCGTESELFRSTPVKVQSYALFAVPDHRQAILPVQRVPPDGEKVKPVVALVRGHCATHAVKSARSLCWPRVHVTFAALQVILDDMMSTTCCWTTIHLDVMDHAEAQLGCYTSCYCVELRSWAWHLAQTG